MKDLYTALAKAQMEMGRLVAGETAQVVTKSGGKYTYSYASLADVLAIARPALNANGIALIQSAPGISYERRPISIEEIGGRRQDPGVVYERDVAVVTVYTTLAHESGDVLVEPLTLITFDVSPQGVGGAVAYGRRYGLQMVCGLAPDTDDDAARASARPAPPPRSQPVAQQPPESAAPPSPLPAPTGDSVSDRLRKHFHALGTEVYGAEWDTKRPELVRVATKRRTTSSKELTVEEMQRLIDGMEKLRNDRALDGAAQVLASPAEPNAEPPF